MTTYVSISGGGAHGAFAVGVLKALRRAGIHFDGVVGTSTGALIAPLIATDEMDLLEEIYTTVRTKDIIRWWPWNLVTLRAWYSTAPLRKLIQRQITPERFERLLASSVEVWVVTVALQTRTITYWNPRSSGPHGDAMTCETFGTAMLASASQPVLMPVVTMADGYQHVDGGVREIAPLNHAITQGAEEVYAIVLSPAHHRPVTAPYQRVVAILLRTFGLLLTEVVTNDVSQAALYNTAVTYVEKLREQAGLHTSADVVQKIFDTFPSPFAGKRLIKLHVLRPDEELPGDGLTFDPQRMRTMVALGEEVAQRYLKV